MFSDTRDFSFSDASISRKSCLVAIRQLSIHGNVGSEILVVGCSSSHQPAGIREEMLECGKLFSGTVVEFPSPYDTPPH